MCYRRRSHARYRPGMDLWGMKKNVILFACVIPALLIGAVSCNKALYVEPVFNDVLTEEHQLPAEENQLQIAFTTHIETRLSKFYYKKAFRFRLNLDGVPGDPVIAVEGVDWKETGGQSDRPATLYVTVPANAADKSRTVSVEISIDNNWEESRTSVEDTNPDWGAWRTIYEGVQAGKVLPE